MRARSDREQGWVCRGKASQCQCLSLLGCEVRHRSERQYQVIGQGVKVGVGEPVVPRGEAEALCDAERWSVQPVGETEKEAGQGLFW
ncbi:hypothetical protein GCM10010342_72090 [Streptomyces anulatus]|nr:hypothetical protein GCM10010342_72090 [Streptomyces anulatus]